MTLHLLQGFQYRHGYKMHSAAPSASAPIDVAELESQTMRRWVFVFLLFVVPFQLVWGAAAPYCAHEGSASAKKHFGHHEHKHQSGSQTTPAADEPNDGTGINHVDCESCHLGCSVALHAAAPEIHAQPPAVDLSYQNPSYTSHVPSGPQRPDRAVSTPAARLGGGVVASLAD